MGSKPISDRASVLLSIVLDSTEHNEAGEPTRYWVPPSDRIGQWSRTFQTHISVGGSGDANALRGLERRGFIRQEKATSYSFSATEAGALHFEREIRETGRLKDLLCIVTKHGVR